MIALRRKALFFAVLLPGVLAAGAQDKATQPLAPMARDADPAFEVAVIKPADPNDRNQGFRLEGHRISIENNTMTSIICFAYSIQKSQIVSAPRGSMSRPGTSTASPIRTASRTGISTGAYCRSCYPRGSDCRCITTSANSLSSRSASRRAAQSWRRARAIRMH